MRRSLILLLSLLAVCAATMYAQPSGAYPRTMFVTYDKAPLYDSASYMSAVVAELRKGDSVHVLGASGKYYRITYGDGERYLLWSNLAAQRPKDGGRKAKAPRNAPKDTGGKSLPADSTGAVSSAASEQPKGGKRETKGTRCRAITKSGGQCSRSATDTSGYCWQHNK